MYTCDNEYSRNNCYRIKRFPKWVLSHLEVFPKGVSFMVANANSVIQRVLLQTLTIPKNFILL